jgi:hypothetical protein
MKIREVLKLLGDAEWTSRRQPLATNLTPVAPWHYIPDFALRFDYVDLMCSLAPKAFLITEGGRIPDHARIRKAYALHEAGANLKISFMPNFADPAKRCRRKMPEGIDAEQYAMYANYDADHYFKDRVAVPWLRKVMPAVAAKQGRAAI